MDPNNTFAQAAPTPSAPPPPIEVKVRTMKSDLAAMARSGGALPTFESVKVNARETPAGAIGATGGKNTTVAVAVVIAGIIALALIAYVAYIALR